MGNVQRSGGNICPVCGQKDIEIYSLDRELGGFFCYECPHCGEFFASRHWYYGEEYSMALNAEHYDCKKLKSYLFYNKGKIRPFLVDEETYKDFEKQDFSDICNVSPAMVEAWYPKTFAEKIDKILLYFGSITSHIGQQISLNYLDLSNIYFVECNSVFDELARIPEQYKLEIDFINDYFREMGLVQVVSYGTCMAVQWNFAHQITVTAKGWARIDGLQKQTIRNKNVFIAMKFGDETMELRKILKQAISEAGYLPVLIDEVQYNGQIVPEMLYQIRESRFVIAELSHHNNGAYYEAGYALGLGKEVIHICEEEAMGSKLHFDVKQVNTITYKVDDLDGLKERLIKRIQATIK